MKKIAIIVAGGSGSRMGADIPKQFLLLGDEPMLFWSMRAFHAYDAALEQLIVLPESHFGYWKEVIKKYDFKLPHRVVEGGKERFFSVKNALDSISENDDALIAIHDAARPFILTEYITALYKQAEERGSALPSLPLKDSIRHWEGDVWTPADRTDFRIIQTPQIFKLLELKKAYLQDYIPAFTDDASVMESAGYAVQMAIGSEDAFKITTAYDMRLAQILADNKQLKQNK